MYSTEETNKHVSFGTSINLDTMDLDPVRIFRSENYNWNLNIKTGFFQRWGKRKEDDPMFSPFGPEICDMEISTICSGSTGKACPWCYKGNTSKGENMSFDTFKKVFNKLPKTVGQIAFGIGDIDANEDLYKIMNYCRENEYNPNVIPNITINGARMNSYHYDMLNSLCGSIAVSRYSHSVDICYDAVYELSIVRNHKQINIHQLISEETYDDCFKVIDDKLNDNRLKNLNAIVFMSLKPKGPRNTFHIVNQEKFNKFVEYALSKNINIGFDSCGSQKFLNSIVGHPNESNFKLMIEPCEAQKFSMYCNSKAVYYPCSFCEDSCPNSPGINILEYEDFVKDVWNNDISMKWRKTLLERNENGDFSCPVFKV